MTRDELLINCLNSDFPQTILTDKSLINNYKYLSTAKLSIYSNTCMQLIQHFHPSIWKASKKDHLSPFLAWKRIECLEKAIDNRLKYKGTNLSPKDIRMGLTLSFVAPKVSIFRPSVAKYIINKYLNQYSLIFDPCSGYSGRLLASSILGKNYIGQDINPITVKESNDIITYFNLENCRVSNKNSLATKGYYECLFTCPPYSDMENWNQDIEVLSEDEWIDICLRNYICNKYVFVVKNTIKYKNYIVEELNNKSYLSNSKEYIIVIDKN